MRRCVLLLLVLVAVAGCGRFVEAPVLFQTIDARTREPIEGVRAVRWELVIHHPHAQIPLGTTDRCGLIGSAVPGFPPSFMFYKDGYGSAEVRVAYETAFVASPSEGNRWYRIRSERMSLPPVAYQTDVASRPLIKVPMWPKE